jgi:hypothetical protein
MLGMDRDLRDAQRAAFHRAALQDGVLDILCGLCLLGWAALMEAGQGALGGILFATIYPTGTALRRKLIEPRLGHVALKGGEMRSKRLLLMGALTFTAIAGVVIFLLSTPPLTPEDGAGIRDRLADLGVIVLGLPLALIATVVGFVYGAARAHGYAAWIMAAFVMGHLVYPEDAAWAEPSLPLALSSLAPLLVGVVLFTRFVRDYPVVTPPAELFDAAD